MSDIERIIGESQLNGEPQRGLKFLLGDNVVKTRHLDDEAVANGKIKDKAVNTRKLDDNAVTSEKLANDAITSQKIKDGSITSAKIGNGEVKTDDIANLAVTTEKINNKAVTTDKIADYAVYNNKIKDGAVTSSKIGAGEVRTDNIKDGAVTANKIAANAVINSKIAANAVTTQKIADRAVTSIKIGKSEVKTENILNKNVTKEKLADGAVTREKIAKNAITLDKLASTLPASITSPAVKELDTKFTNITNELYSMVRSLQPNGVALSNQFGDREDIGITQKSLTKALGKAWEIIEELTGRTYMDFTLTVNPEIVYSEDPSPVTIVADCTDAISDFDNIKIYINDVLVRETSDVSVVTISEDIDDTSEIKAVGMILGKTITKTATAIKEAPFFMGSGQNYTDIMKPEYLKEIINESIEGDYDITVKNDNEHIFIVIPASRKSEFRRATMVGLADINGIEIPLEQIAETDVIVAYKSLNTYRQGTYNIDIDIDS